MVGPFTAEANERRDEAPPRPSHRAEGWLTPERTHPGQLAKAALIESSFAWVPIVLLAMARYWILGEGDGFLLRSEVHVRLVFALYLFLIATISFEQRLRGVTINLVEGGVLSASGAQAWQVLMKRVGGLLGSTWPRAVLLVAIYAQTFAAYMGWLPSWLMRWLAPTLHAADLHWVGNSPAWWWYVLVGQPIFLYLFGRVLFRWGLWTWALWKLPRLDPRILPAHADRAGGLAFLAGPLVSLRFVVLGTAASLASVWLDEIAQGRAIPATFARDFIQYILIATGIALAPYLRFVPVLFYAKSEGERQFSAFVREYVVAFNRRWLEGPHEDDKVLGHGDIQSLADIGNSYSVVREMRVVIPGTPAIRALVVCAVLPFTVIVLVYSVSAVQVIQHLFSRFLGT